MEHDDSKKEPVTLTLGEIALRLTEACIKDTKFEWSKQGTMASDAVRIQKVPELFKEFLAELAPEDSEPLPGEKAESDTVKWPMAAIKCAGMGCGYEYIITAEQPKGLPRIHGEVRLGNLDHTRCPKCNALGALNVEFIK